MEGVAVAGAQRGKVSSVASPAQKIMITIRIHCRHWGSPSCSSIGPLKATTSLDLWQYINIKSFLTFAKEATNMKIKIRFLIVVSLQSRGRLGECGHKSSRGYLIKALQLSLARTTVENSSTYLLRPSTFCGCGQKIMVRQEEMQRKNTQLSGTAVMNTCNAPLTRVVRDVMTSQYVNALCVCVCVFRLFLFH